MSIVKQALIIAAGNGSRLQPVSGEVPKPLTPVCGIPLLTRLLHEARRAGIESFVIVLGYQGEMLRRALERDPGLSSLSIKWVVNDEWKLANGLSVLKAKDLLTEDFVLLMADHLFQSATLARLLRRRPDPGEVILAVDRKIDQVYDIDDATKVKIDGMRILSIGKEIKDYNAVDTGMFLCTPAIFAGLEKAKHEGNCSLSEGMKELVQTGKLRFFDVKDAWWLDVDTPAALRQAERNLFNHLRNQDEGFVERSINRPLSLRLTRALLTTPVTSQMLRGITLGVAILGACLLAQAGAFSVFLGALLFQGLSILNLSAEELAKLRMEESLFNSSQSSWLEKMTYFALLMGVVFGYFRHSGEHLVLLLGALTLFDAFLALSILEKRFHFGKQNGNDAPGVYALRDEEETRRFGTPSSLQQSIVDTLLGLGKIFVKPHQVAFLVLVLALFGKLGWIFWGIFFGTHLAALRLFYTQSPMALDSSATLPFQK